MKFKAQCGIRQCSSDILKRPDTSTMWTHPTRPVVLARAVGGMFRGHLNPVAQPCSYICSLEWSHKRRPLECCGIANHDVNK